MSTELTIPSARELEALSPQNRWDIEESLDEAQDVLREFNDDELRKWVEGGKTQRWIAEQVGRSQQRISQRCAALGLSTASNRGRPRITSPSNSDPEIIDAEVVDDEPPVRPKARRTSAPEGPVHHYPDVVAPDAEDNLRTQALLWFEQGAHIKELLDSRRPLEPRSDDDRKAIKREASAMERVARRLKEAANAQ